MSGARRTRRHPRAGALPGTIGNCDGHAKNFSLLREGDSLRLAPLYDLVSTRAYPALSVVVSAWFRWLPPFKEQ